MVTEYLSSMDVRNSGWAEHYASMPYGQYKHEAYPLFARILDHVGPAARILDVGAGSGNLETEYARLCPDSEASFVLLDASSALLRIAKQRLEGRPTPVETVHRTYRTAGWCDGLGNFDAVVSNNAPFTVEKAELKRFFVEIFSHLKASGILLYQYPFAYFGRRSAYGKSALASFMKGLPAEILPENLEAPESERVRLEERKKKAGERHKKALAEARASGAILPDEGDWEPIGMEEHLAILTDVGFECGCIWRKRNYGAVIGVKIAT